MAEGFQIDKRFKKRMQGKFERFTLQAGILKDKPHREPRPVNDARLKPKAKTKKKSLPKPRKVSAKKKKRKSKSFIKKILGKAKKKLKNTVTTSAYRKEQKRKAMVASHRARGLGTMEGGPVRLKKAKVRGTVAEVGEYVRKVHKIPYLTRPFENPNTPETKKFTRAFFQLLSGKEKSYSKVESLLRDIIRIPILKKKYGSNSAKARKVKTFDRLAIDTGQFYQAISAKIRVNQNVPK